MRIRPVGNGMIDGAIGFHPGHVKAVTERVQSHHTVPHGTDAICAFPGTSRHATFTLSLRDEIRLCAGQAAWPRLYLAIGYPPLPLQGRRPATALQLFPLSSSLRICGRQATG